MKPDRKSFQFLQWQVGADRLVDLDDARLMGILNVTPDSFSDGGAYPTIESAVDAALEMKAAGACIIDVGGESTRPGAAVINAQEQVRRTEPVIRGIRSHLDQDELLISIDTTQFDVARAALDAGADIINDVSAGRDDDRMLALAAAKQCGLILMHRRTAPQNDSYSDQYNAPPDYGGDVVQFVRRFLADRCDAAVSAGVSPRSIVIDPGLGFGKSVQQNFELINRTCELMDLGYPILSAASRKSFIGAASGATDPNPRNRVYGSIAVSLAHFHAGVRLFRVHDVAAQQQALSVAQATTNFPAGIIRPTSQFQS